MLSTARSASWLPLISNSILVALKLGVGVTIGSISVVADALDTAVDVLSALVVFIGVRVASRPADPDHPFGHGKAESVSSLVESGFILGGGGFVLSQAVHRLLVGTPLRLVEAGIAVMAFSALVNLGVAWHLGRVARRTGSPALAAAAQHRLSDLFTSGAVLLGLVAVALTGLRLLDPLIALGIGGLILWTGFRVARTALEGLMDRSLPPGEEEAIAGVVRSVPEVVDLLRLRTRQVGPHRHIELTLALCCNLTVAEAHAIADQVEEALHHHFPGSHITTHIEPCTRASVPCPHHSGPSVGAGR